MFGNLGQLMNIMKNAGAIKQSMQEMNERMEAARHTGEAGGGQVQATVNGQGDVLAVKIEPALVQAGDVEMIEDLTCAAVRDAVARSREAAQQEMAELTGGLGLPGMDQMLGGGGQ
jgi:DNA-binding YbaB/EbfC family protein